MRYILLLAAAISVFAISCDGDGAEPTATIPPTIPPATATIAAAPTLAPDASATPGTVPRGPFRPFADEIHAAAGRHDAGWFQQRLVTTHVACDESNTPPDLGDPRCEFVGQEFEGFAIGAWRSEGSVVPDSEVTAIFNRLFDNVVAEASDEFGTGEPVVYAISDEGAKGTAVITAVVERPENFADGGPLRVSLVTDWTMVDGEWRMEFLLIAYVLGEEFLIPAPETESFVPNWERF